VELLLDVGEGRIAEEFVDVLELVRAEMGELGERLEGMGAMAAQGRFLDRISRMYRIGDWDF
jgi:hypothetical protein